MTAGIPLTIVGGYLGSGKTSAISELLSSGAARDVAVIVNDFGELDFDARLLAGGTDDLVNFSNGCVCCAASDGMSAALETLRSRAPRRVIVEASGVGDPAALSSWSTMPGYAPGGVIVCVDALTIGSRLRDKWVGDTVARQLAAADVLLLTHADIANDAVLEGALFLVKLRAPQAQILVRRASTGLASALLAVDDEASDVVAAGIVSGTHAEHDTWTVRSEGPVERRLLEAALAALPIGVVRVKGVVRLADSADRLHSVQAVGRRFAIADLGSANPGADENGSALVVIARPGTDHRIDRLSSTGLTESHPAEGLAVAHAHSH